jgi:hypothetical protein
MIQLLIGLCALIIGIKTWVSHPNENIYPYHQASEKCENLFKLHVSAYWFLQHVEQIDKFAYLEK